MNDEPVWMGQWWNNPVLIYIVEALIIIIVLIQMFFIIQDIQISVIEECIQIHGNNSSACTVMLK